MFTESKNKGAETNLLLLNPLYLRVSEQKMFLLSQSPRFQISPLYGLGEEEDMSN